MTAPVNVTGGQAPVGARVREMLVLGLALLAAFLVINLVHFRFFEVSVILYACVVDAVLASAIVFGPYIWLRRAHGPLLGTEIALAAMAGNLLLLLYSVMGPTVIDRSLSIYIVEKIENRGGAVSEAAMPKIILTEFMNEYHVAEVRMTEQVTSGTVQITDGCIRITPRGRLVAVITKFYREHFLPRKRRVGGQITSELTRPYADTPVLVPFECPSIASEETQ